MSLYCDLSEPVWKSKKDCMFLHLVEYQPCAAEVMCLVALRIRHFCGLRRRQRDRSEAKHASSSYLEVLIAEACMVVLPQGDVLCMQVGVACTLCADPSETISPYSSIFTLLRMTFQVSTSRDSELLR